MMPNLPANSMPKAPAMGAPAMQAKALAGPLKSPPAAGMKPFSAPAAPMDRSSLPSLQATQNEATPIELGDPQRLAKIATILRMGRK